VPKNSEFEQLFYANLKDLHDFYHAFSIYSSKLHDICSTSNLVHPPFKLTNFT